MSGPLRDAQATASQHLQNDEMLPEMMSINHRSGIIACNGIHNSQVHLVASEVINMQGPCE